MLSSYLEISEVVVQIFHPFSTGLSFLVYLIGLQFHLEVEAFSGKDRILGFVSYVAFITTTQLLCCSMKATTSQYKMSMTTCQ